MLYGKFYSSLVSTKDTHFWDKRSYFLITSLSLWWYINFQKSLVSELQLSLLYGGFIYFIELQWRPNDIIWEIKRAGDHMSFLRDQVKFGNISALGRSFWVTQERSKSSRILPPLGIALGCLITSNKACLVSFISNFYPQTLIYH